jgi:hypothetical protein
MHGVGRHSRRRQPPQTRRLLWSCPLAVIVCTIVAGISLHRSSQAEELISLDAQPPTLMVLFDGRVMYGQISERPGGYMIEAPDSKQVIPHQMIRLLASSLEDAYVKQRDTMKMPTAGDHLLLAQWCLDNKLYGPTTEQLEAALKLEPNRSEARRLLLEVAALTQPQAPAGGLRYTGTTGRSTQIERTAAGISPDAQAEFVRRVQPILVNRCGNATCHGSAAENSFKLINVRSGQRQQRLETETNLAAVLQQINSAKPAESPLLVRSMDPDSRAHRGAFSAAAGTSQQDRLREWVRQVARDQRGTNPAKEAWATDESEFAAQAAYAFGADPSKTPRDDGVRQAAGEVEIAEPDAADAEVESPLLIEIPRTPQAKPQTAPAGGNRNRVPPSTQGTTRTPKEQSALLRQILEEDRPDAFDPNEFNRKAHSRAGAR